MEMPESPESQRGAQADRHRSVHLRSLFNETDIQPQAQSMTKCQRVMAAIDIFSFIPVPQTRPVSTKRSKCGSIILIIIFVAYVVYDFVELILNNAPKVNTYELPLSSTPYAVPQMAIGFIYGPQLNMTLNDTTYMTISLLEINTTQGKGVQNPASMYNCPQLSWMQDLQNFYQNLSCINTSTVSLEGLVYASPVSLYPRFVVTAGNQSQAAMANMTGGGRIFLFIQKNQSVNLATGSSSSDSYGSFQFYNFFIIPGLYNRITITFQPTTYVIYPDYITSFRKKTILDMPIIDQQFQTSNVSAYNPLDMLSISILLSTQSRVNEVVYSTLIEHVSLWGAFWGVLFSLFAFYFLMFNRKMFYDKTPDWNRFEEKVKKIEREIRRQYSDKLIQMEERNRNGGRNSLQVPLRGGVRYDMLDEDSDVHSQRDPKNQ